MTFKLEFENLSKPKVKRILQLLYPMNYEKMMKFPKYAKHGNSVDEDVILWRVDEDKPKCHVCGNGYIENNICKTCGCGFIKMTGGDEL